MVVLTPVVQRWRLRRDTYRPVGECFDPSVHEVASIPDDTTAKQFVVTHHYANSYPAARFRFGLYRAHLLVGVAVFSVPMTAAVLRPFPADASAELGRFVLLDHVRANGETWFLARCFDLLRREGLAGIVSFSDPTPRTDATGMQVFPGHIGTIYQASNAVYAGRASPASLRLLPDGTVFSNRAQSKIRKTERGWRYSAGQLVAHGAAPLEGDPRAWLAHWLPRITRGLRHHGNHKYLFALDRSARKLLPEGLAYPKFARAA